MPLLVSCSGLEYRRAEGIIWHTAYHVTYNSDCNLEDSILASLNSVGNSLNVFDNNSLVSRVNAGDSVAVDSDFVRVYEASVNVYKLSDGAFDPTLGPLIMAWGFGRGHTATADTLRVDSLLSIVGIARTHLDHGLLVKEDPRIEFNFSAIAKGYGCDRVARMLAANGSDDYLIEIGGEIACAGVSPSGDKWRISIDRPVVQDSVTHESQCIIEISDCGVATSGNYRNFHGEGNNRYGHTISAQTGRPVQTDVLSATVVATTAMEADALATAMMAMGAERAKNLAARLRLPVMLVLANHEVFMTPEFGALLAK